MIYKVDAVMAIYDFAIGKHREAIEVLRDYDDVRRKNAEKNVGADDLIEVAKILIVKLNNIAIQIMRKNDMPASTSSPAIANFMMKHSVELKLQEEIWSVITREFPNHVVDDSGKMNVDLDTLFDLVDQQSVMINSMMRDAIVFGLVDGEIPEWIYTFSKISHLITSETKELLDTATERLKLFQ